MRPSLRRLPALTSAALILLSLVPVRGQVIIVDRRPHVPVARSFEIKEVSLDARVKEQVAEVQVAQTFHNPGSFELEAEFLFPVPEDVAIQNLVLLADGKELPGRLLDKDEARRIYEEIVRRKRDPALLEYMGRGLFKTSVFPIPPGADRKVTLRYTQLLKRDGDVVELAYPFGSQKFTSKPIERLELTARIESKVPIKSLYSPGHDVEIKRDGDHEARVKLVQHDVIPNADFRLLVTLNPGPVGTTVLSYRPSASEDGYFLLLASPRVEREREEKPRPKTVVFVLDRSGSMSGKKIEQARDSLKFVLDNLREDDLFNILVYDDRVEAYKPELQRYSSQTRSDAIRYVDNIRPGGSTNIDEALREGLDMIDDDSRPSYLLFLTDGLPTAGETGEQAIAEHAKDANDHDARIFSFGVGYDVNARLLDRLSAQNRGASEYVKPDEDLEARVARFFGKLTSPVLSKLSIKMRDTDVNRTYPRDLPDLFEGGQIVYVGRYRESGDAHLVLKGQIGDETREYTTDIDLASPGEGRRYEFIARLWAIRRVGDILDQIDLHGKNSELVDELVELSRKYGILTPYTSFLADERTDLHASLELRREATDNLSSFRVESGIQGVGQRANKQAYQLAERATDSAVPFAAAPEAESRLGNSVAASPVNGPVATQPARGASVAGEASSAGGFGGAAGRMASGGVNRYSASGMSSMMSAGAAAPGNVAMAKDLEGRDQIVGSVRNVGGKTFYLRNGVWVDSEVMPEDEPKATKLTQFTEGYFDLARKQSAEQNQYLAFAEPVVVKLADGQVYRIDPAPATP